MASVIKRETCSVDEYRAAVLQLADGWLGRTEVVRLDAALDRVLAKDITATFELPRFAQSAMDGFAVRAEDVTEQVVDAAARDSGDGSVCPTGRTAEGPDGGTEARDRAAVTARGVVLPVVGLVLAGSEPAPLFPGTAVRIMTGAPLPPGADTVIPFEQAQFDDATVRPAGPVTPGSHVRHPGEDVTAGEVVLPAGTRLGPRHLGAAAAVGRSHLTVVRRPRVAVITTGDELRTPADGRPDGPIHGDGSGGSTSDNDGTAWAGRDMGRTAETSAVNERDPLGTSGIYDSNATYLTAALTEAGAEVAGHWRCPDDPRALEAALDEAKSSDLILVTGGASVGDRDVSRAVLEARGARFVAVAMQPGKPQGLGHWATTPVLCLPGNPVSVAVSFAVFVRPLLAAMRETPGTVPTVSPPVVTATITEGWQSPAGRRQFFPVRCDATPIGLTARPATPGGAGSHLVTSLAQADGFAEVPESVATVRPGDHLPIIPL